MAKTTCGSCNRVVAFFKFVGFVLVLAILCVAVLGDSECHGVSEESDSPRLPCLAVRGSYYEVGLSVGKRFRERILQFHAQSEKTQMLQKFAKSDDGREHLKRWFSAMSGFPNVVSEMRGLADGTSLSLDEIFLYHCSSEVGLLLEDKSMMLPSCSSLLVQQPGKTLIGHNEDGNPPCYNTSYLVQAEIVQNGTTVEQFTAFAYAGVVPGKAFGFNHHGLVLTNNAIFGRDLNKNILAVPRAVLSRAVLSAQSVEEIMTKTAAYSTSSSKAPWQPVASFSMNIGDRSTDNLVNMEFSTNGVSVQSVSNGFLHHFNMFVHTAVPQHIDASSVHRTTTLLNTGAGPSDVNTTLTFLSDQSDTEYPVFRQGRAPDDVYTLATALFDIVRGTCHIFLSRPLSGATPAYEFKL